MDSTPKTLSSFQSVRPPPPELDDNTAEVSIAGLIESTLAEENVRLYDRVRELETLVAGYQVATQLDVGNSGDASRVQPEDLARHVLDLRLELNTLEGLFERALELLEDREWSWDAGYNANFCPSCGGTSRGSCLPVHLAECEWLNLMQTVKRRA